MPVNFPNSPTNNQSYTSAGKTYTYNSTKTVWTVNQTLGYDSATVINLIDSDYVQARTTAGTDSSQVISLVSTNSNKTNTVADLAALGTLSGMTTGDQALVTSNNKLFMYNGTGWYLIATITNASPSAITGVDSNYALATDGTAIVINAISTDPEGAVLTWSSSTSGLSDIATITQGTGDSSNYFTITPASSDSTSGGTFTLTIAATDGVNGAVNWPIGFTLAFVVDWSGLSLTSSLQYPGTLYRSSLFGEVVAIDGNYAVISARNYNDGTSPIGKAWVYFKSGGTWALQTALPNTDTTSNSSSNGQDVAIDGDTIVVPDGNGNGHVRVYTRSGTTWSLQQKITGTGTAMAGFGKSSIALSGDRLAVGCYSYATPGANAGRIAVYSRTGSTWSFEAFLDPSDVAAGDLIGYHSLHMSGNYIIAGEIVGAGSAYIWFYNGSSWVQQQKLTASDGSSGDYFGINCVIDGDIAVVSAPWVASEKGSVYVYTRSGTTWTESAKLGASGSIPSDLVAGHQFGMVLSLDGSSLICGAPHMAGGGSNGAADAYIFTTTDGGSTWTQGKKLTSPKAFNDAYAYDRRSVAIDETSESAIVGAGKDNTGGSAPDIHLAKHGMAYFYDT
jgi:hypothetical protein